MKKFLLFALLTSLCQFSIAQIELRPQVGYNASSLTKDLDLGNFAADQGMQFGLDLLIGNRFYVQPGLLWETVNNQFDQGGENGLINFQVNRVRIPLLVGYRLFSPQKTGRYFNLRLFTGPNASFAINKEVDEDSLAFTRDDLKNSVFGWHAGFGLDIAILFLDAGYTFGLSEVFKDLPSGPRNNLFYANGGVRIRF